MRGRWVVLLALLAVAVLAGRVVPGGGQVSGQASGQPPTVRRLPEDLDRAGRVPAYLQLAQLLRQEVMSGQLAPGDPVPSQNELAAAYAVSVETARKAVEVLREEGLIVTRRGAGSYAAVPPSRITVTASPDDVVTARMPTPAERAALGIAEGVPVISVRRPGRAEEVFDANRADIVIGSG